MQTVPMKLITIVAEPVLEHALVEAVHALGATGHTIAETIGAGSRGVLAAEFPGEGRRIEVLVDESTADRILEHVATKYFTDYAVIAWMSDVHVLRAEKYRAGAPHPVGGAR